MLVVGFAIGLGAVEVLLGGRVVTFGGGRELVTVPAGRIGAGRAAEGTEPEGRGGSPVDGFPDGFPDATGRTDAGLTTGGAVLIGRTGRVPAGRASARGTRRLGFGGSILDDDDAEAIGERSGFAVKGEARFSALSWTFFSAFSSLRASLASAFAALAAAAATFCAASVSSFSSWALSFLR